MSAAASNYTKSSVINAFLRGAAFPVPTNTCVSLHTANPGEAGGRIKEAEFRIRVRDRQSCHHHH